MCLKVKKWKRLEEKRREEIRREEKGGVRI